MKTMILKIEQKTFKVIDGKVFSSSWEKQSRISKLLKLAKEYGFKVVFLF